MVHVAEDEEFTTELHGGTTVSCEAAATRVPPGGSFLRVPRECEKKLSVLPERRVSRKSTSRRQAGGKLPMLLMLPAILRGCPTVSFCLTMYATRYTISS